MPIVEKKWLWQWPARKGQGEKSEKGRELTADHFQLAADSWRLAEKEI